MAKAYLDLWQEQWSVFASDPEWQKRIVDNMMQMESFFGKMPKPNDFSSAPGTAPAQSSPDDSAALLDEFSRRIAILEERLARLEQKNSEHKSEHVS